jgi:hypothetical protein
MADRQVVQAKDSFAATINGYPKVVSVGDRFYSDDPIVKGREDLFEPQEVQKSWDDGRLAKISSPLGSAVETAVAEPGVRRRRSRSVESSEV